MSISRSPPRKGAGPPWIQQLEWADQTGTYPELDQLSKFASTEAKAIAKLPIRRNLVLKRNGKIGSLGKDRRSHNLAPTLAYLRGEINSPKCRHCQNFIGPFRECVSMKGYFGSACTNCAYNDHGERCSLRSLTPPVPDHVSASDTGQEQFTILGSARGYLQSRKPSLADGVTTLDRLNGPQASVSLASRISHEKEQFYSEFRDTFVPQAPSLGSRLSKASPTPDSHSEVADEIPENAAKAVDVSHQLQGSEQSARNEVSNALKRQSHEEEELFDERASVTTSNEAKKQKVNNGESKPNTTQIEARDERPQTIEPLENSVIIPSESIPLMEQSKSNEKAFGSPEALDTPAISAGSIQPTATHIETMKPSVPKYPTYDSLLAEARLMTNDQRHAELANLYLRVSVLHETISDPTKPL